MGVTFNNKAHGALSWYFAKALAGEADADNNKRLSRLELEEYLKSQSTWQSKLATNNIHQD
ncbi:hypothetical protein [Candidatus Marithrix sp. Canyon 246]|uniref:hypothetical protein n=1 Tax=Candidatus Marithrix sp. Canyon 246 TaxID=1827136 RepID=UPI000849F8F2|nr:hypothetical protein [Candidatus Marithrix sp. Canyon 246]